MTILLLIADTGNRSDDGAIAICTAVIVHPLLLLLEALHCAVPRDSAAHGAGAETRLDNMRSGLLEEGGDDRIGNNTRGSARST